MMETSEPSRMAELLRCRDDLIAYLDEALAAGDQSKEVQTLTGALAMIDDTIRASKPTSSGRHKAQKRAAA